MPKDVKKIAIVGYGFVGKAIEFGFSKNTKILKIDPKLNVSINELENFKPDFIFLCVPTPMTHMGQDCTILKSVITDIERLEIKCTVIIKSTVLPEEILNIEQTSPLEIVYNPEFLREKHYKKDFCNSDVIILSGKETHVKSVENLYKNNSVCKNLNFARLDAYSAALAKYAINSYLATKIIFFNELKNIHDLIKTNSTWNEITEVISMDKRIGNSHMDVPGHDGKLGFGGACFPKDTYALLKSTQKNGRKFQLLEKVIEINNNIRSQYSELEAREKEQNIKFK